MKKIYMKLAASVMSILIAFTMIIGATYAWFTLSSSPEVGGINVSIGGGRTILLAPDLTTEADGVTIHYPGKFESTLNISQHESYQYLNQVSGLSPVSTADGLYWLLPVYDEETGALKEFRNFEVDSTLEHGNTTRSGGSYLYLDFWIVSPGSAYDIRVSMDSKEDTGSYLIELPKAEAAENGSLTLGDTQGIVEAVARVGFLVNTDSVSETAETVYRESEAYVKQFENLLGSYPEKGQEPSGEYQFSIYEPNATSHPSEGMTDGEYMITKPLSYNPYGKAISEKDVSDRLMVQEKNTWITLGSAAESTKLEQFFQSYIINKKDLTADTAASMFYQEYQGQLGSYVKSGNFYKKTAALYNATENGTAGTDAVKKLMTAGAADDVMITSIAPNTPQRIRMYIWLEGQDADCTNSASVDASSFALNLEFAGATP